MHETVGHWCGLVGSGKPPVRSRAAARRKWDSFRPSLETLESLNLPDFVISLGSFFAGFGLAESAAPALLADLPPDVPAVSDGADFSSTGPLSDDAGGSAAADQEPLPDASQASSGPTQTASPAATPMTQAPTPEVRPSTDPDPDTLFADGLQPSFADPAGTNGFDGPLPVASMGLGQLPALQSSGGAGPEGSFTAGMATAPVPVVPPFTPDGVPPSAESSLAQAAASSPVQAARRSGDALPTPPAPALGAPAASPAVVAPAQQDPAPTRFEARGTWFEAAVGATGFTFTPTAHQGSVAVQFVGGDPSAPATATAPPAGTSGFLSAAPAGASAGGSASFAGAEYHDVYPGIDIQYTPTPNQNLEYSFVVRPGADPGRIRLAVPGAGGVNLDAQGNLVLHTATGDVVSQAPTLFQEVNGARVSVQGGYELLPGGQVGFLVRNYDRAEPLTIDPGMGRASKVLCNSSSSQDLSGG